MIKYLKFNFKVLAVYDSCLLAARGYSINKYSLDGHFLAHVGNLIDTKYAMFSRCKFTRRLMRAEITALYDLGDDRMLAVAKKGFFLKEKGRTAFEKVFCVPRGSKPLNLCFTEDGMVYFGEYFQNTEKDKVNIYISKDNCKTWNVVYTIPAGNINHIHGIFADPYTNNIWVVTGDRENECIIGWTDDGFKSLHEIFRGGQEYRNCHLFFYKDYIIYATDSQYIENKICCIDRKTLKITVLQKIQGSVIKGGQHGDFAFISTTVEPSKVNHDKYSHIWVSYNGLEWNECFKGMKDCYPFLFQYATFEFPQYHKMNDKLYFTGRAVRGCDAKTIVIQIKHY